MISHMKSNITAKASTSIHAQASEVWDALTKPEIIKQYFFGTDTHTDWKPGHPIRFTGEWEGKRYEDKGTVLEVEQGKRIKYNYWSSMSGTEDKPENYVDITYELSPDGDRTKVSIMQENIPDEKTKKHSEETWGKVLEGMKHVVEGK